MTFGSRSSASISSRCSGSHAGQGRAADADGGHVGAPDGVVERAKRAGAQVAVLDIPHPTRRALSLCRALADAGVAVVAYCESEAPGTVQRALDAGALGVVSKSEHTAEVLRAGYVVARGSSTSPRGCSRRLARPSPLR